MKFLRLALAFFTLNSVISFAEELPAVNRKMQISINPLQLVLGKLPLNFHVALTDKIALGVEAHGRFFTWDKEKYYGGGGGISAKFFLSGKAIESSWYVEPSFSAYYAKLGDVGYWGLSPEVLAGYAWVFKSGFSINLGLGVGYEVAFIKNEKAPFGISGLVPTGEFSLGWTW